MKTWKTWTVSDETRLAELRARKVTLHVIAVEMDRSYNSIKCKVYELQMLPVFLDQRERWMELLVGAPVSLKTAAKIMGVTIHAVKRQKRMLRHAGFDVPHMRGQ